MRTYFTLIFMIIAATPVSRAQTMVESDPPFIVHSCNAIGPSESGTTLKLQVISGSGVEFKKVFYRGRWAVLQPTNQGDRLLMEAWFPPRQKSLNMHADPRKEVGNQPPLIPSAGGKERVFQTGKSEAVILYEKEGKSYYYRLGGITRATTN